jgi:hypothetical protein
MCAFFGPGPITSCRSLVSRAWGQYASLCSGLDLREAFRVRGLWPPPPRESGLRLDGALQHATEASRMTQTLSTVDGRPMPLRSVGTVQCRRCAGPLRGSSFRTSARKVSKVQETTAPGEMAQPRSRGYSGRCGRSCWQRSGFHWFRYGVVAGTRHRRARRRS